MTPRSFYFQDAGRKFFNVDSVKKLLSAVADAGLDAMVLYFSDNQGFRFGLRDMTITTRWGTCDLSRALGDGYSEYRNYPDGTNKAWTEADMEQILAYARERKVELIPALNMPGHMGAILQTQPQLRYPGSNGSIDLGRPEAVDFACAILEKYAGWFAQRGCRFFCYGGDEFANDLGKMGLDVIYHSGEMKLFVEFSNRVAGIIERFGMTPMAFNDGFCYGNDTATYDLIDKKIWVFYWTAGWDTYHPASPETLVKAGYHVVNCGFDYYCGADTPDWPERVEKMKSYDYRAFDKGHWIPESGGAMLCCWCGRANHFGPDEGVTLVRCLKPVIAEFGRTMEKIKCVTAPEDNRPASASPGDVPPQ